MQEPDQSFQRLLYIIIVAQFIIIALLLGAFSNEYLSNAYFQAWVQRNAPGLDILLNGGADAFIIGIAIALTYLFIRSRRETVKSRHYKGQP